jgi:hypothetical protein
MLINILALYAKNSKKKWDKVSLPKVSNSTIKELSDSEEDEFWNNELKEQW